MEQQRETTNHNFSNIHILICDFIAFALIDKYIHQQKAENLDPFLEEEMVPVCILPAESLIEIRKEDESFVPPFRVKGRSVSLSPQFFGQGYRLYINGSHCLDLSLDYWCEMVGNIDDIAH